MIVQMDLQQFHSQPGPVDKGTGVAGGCGESVIFQQVGRQGGHENFGLLRVLLWAPRLPGVVTSLPRTGWYGSELAEAWTPDVLLGLTFAPYPGVKALPFLLLPCHPQLVPVLT